MSLWSWAKHRWVPKVGRQAGRRWAHTPGPLWKGGVGKATHLTREALNHPGPSHALLSPGSVGSSLKNGQAMRRRGPVLSWAGIFLGRDGELGAVEWVDRLEEEERDAERCALCVQNDRLVRHKRIMIR